VKYYKMMVEYHTVEKEAWDICNCYYKIYDTTLTRADPPALQDAFESCIIFLLLSPHDNHQMDMCHRLRLLLTKESETASVFTFTLSPVFLLALTLFTTKEIIPYPFAGQDELERHPCLARHAVSLDAAGPAHDAGSSTAMAVAAMAVGPAHWSRLLRTRVVQHNLRTVAAYYQRIHTTRLADLVGLTRDELEEHLSEIAETSPEFIALSKGSKGRKSESKGGTDLSAGVGSTGVVGMYVKVDRPAGIITFKRPRAPEAVLSDWSSDVTQMMRLMESTCHLINREIMVHKA